MKDHPLCTAQFYMKEKKERAIEKVKEHAQDSAAHR